MLFIIILSMIAWLMMRPYLPQKYLQVIILGTIGLLVFPAAFLPKLISHDVAYNILWPLAGGIILGEFVRHQGQRLISFHHRFTTPQKNKNTPSSKKESRPTQKKRES